MTREVEEAIARIHKSSGEVIGAGFLVSEKHVLTCAHVVNVALGKKKNAPEEPTSEISLDFPHVEVGKKFAGRVVRWIPVKDSTSILPDEGADIAVLELQGDAPASAKPVRLVENADLQGHQFRVFGFPEGQAVGVWTDGIIQGKQANGRVQIEVVRQTAYKIEPGFSGSPVWDEQLDGVAGMTVAIDNTTVAVGSTPAKRPDLRAAFIIPTTQLFNAWSSLGDRANPPNPYRGLSAFQEEDAKFFFGREAFTEQLVGAVQTKQLVAVIGASGSGKSSVVFAGLIPQLRSQQTWLIDSFRPGDRPLRNLVAKLVPLLEPQMSETDRLVEVEKLETFLGQGNLALRDVVTRILEKNARTRLLLVADQFEELYTLCKDEKKRHNFLDRLLEAVNLEPNFHLVLTLRADFLGYALSYRPFADALQNADVKLGPMNRQELREAIEKPAQLRMVGIEEGLTERILEAVEKSPGNLPLLEFALTQLWEKQRKGQLTHDAYEEIGGVEKAIAKYAEEKYDQLSDGDKQRAQRVFIQLVRPGEGTGDTRRLATRAEVGEENWELVTSLADARLVVTGRDEATDSETVEVVHEALIREWETLREWIKTDREFRTWQDRLREAMGQWKTNKRKQGYLLGGALLGEAEDWFHKRKAQLSEEERDFIGASLAWRRRNNLLLGGGLVGALILAGAAGWQWQQAEKSQIQVLTNSSAGFFASSRKFDALRESLKAAKQLKKIFWADASIRKEVGGALQQAIYALRPPNNHIAGHTDEVNSAVFSPNGKMLASASWDKTVKLWDVATGKEIKTLEGHSDVVIRAVFSPNGKMLASASTDKTVKLWDVATGKEIKTLNGHSGSVNSAVFSRDGKMLASASSDNTVKLWDVATREEIKTLKGHSSSVNSAVFSPNGKMLASASSDNTVKLWDVATREEIKTLKGHSQEVNSAVFSPNGTMLASASDDNTVKLWDVATGNVIKTLNGHSGSVNSAVFSRDGKMLASASNDNTVKLWDVAIRKEIKTLNGHGKEVWSAVFSPDGTMLASTSDDNTFKLWDVARGKEIKTLKVHSEEVNSAVFSPNGTMLASASDDKTVKLWDVATGKEIKTLNGHSEEVNSAVFSPNGTILASASYDKTVKLWDVATRKVIKTLKGHSEEVNSAVFSPNGTMLASASWDNTVKLWDVATGNVIKTLKGHSDRVNSAVFSPDGTMLASASSDKTVKLWDVATREEIKTLKVHSEEVNSAVFSPNGTMLASASDDKTVKLWDVATGKEIKTLNGHSSSVISAVFSPDGKMLASASIDKTVKLWDVATGKELATYKGHTKPVRSVAFSPDGKMLVSASNDQTVRLWNLDWDLVEALTRDGCDLVREHLKDKPDAPIPPDLCEDIPAGEKPQ